MLAINGRMNVPDFEVNANIAWSTRLQYPVARQQEFQDLEAILVGGGPSINTQIDEIKRLKNEEGAVLVTMNGSHDWCLDLGLIPQIHIMMDARAKNASFLKRPVESCKYLIASQCAPEVFRALKDYDVTIWHSANTKLNKEMLDEYYMGFPWCPVVGGCSVGTRALHLLRLIGVSNKFHLFGYDSCVTEDEYTHHAYPQWDDTKAVMKVRLAKDKVFYCQPWMFQQAKEFIKIIQAHGEHMKLAVYGDGLIQEIIRLGGIINGGECLESI